MTIVRYVISKLTTVARYRTLSLQNNRSAVIGWKIRANEFHETITIAYRLIVIHRIDE